MVLKKQTAVVHQRLFPFYFTLFWKDLETQQHSNSPKYRNYDHMHSSLSRVGVFFPLFLFSFRVKGILLPLQAVCICVKLSSYCRVFQSVMLNLCIRVLYNFHIHTHTHMHINFNIFYIYIYLHIVSWKYTYRCIFPSLTIAHGILTMLFFFPLKSFSISELYLFMLCLEETTFAYIIFTPAPHSKKIVFQSSHIPPP